MNLLFPSSEYFSQCFSKLQVFLEKDNHKHLQTNCVDFFRNGETFFKNVQNDISSLLLSCLTVTKIKLETESQRREKKQINKGISESLKLKVKEKKKNKEISKLKVKDSKQM